MRFLVILFLLLPLQGHSQNSVSAQTFQVNVKPVLNGILNDFYQMIVLFPEVPRELVEIIDEVERLGPSKESLKRDCPRLLEKKCLTTIDSLRDRLHRLSEKTMALQRRQGLANSLHLTSLSGIRVMGDFQKVLEALMAKMDNISFMFMASAPIRQETFPLIRQFDELGTYTSLALVEYIPYIYKEDFRHFYFGFVYPIQTQLEKATNYQFLNRNLNDLNFAINLLNMNLTKRNKKTPDGMGPYLSTIHNRWNSILRYYF